jgi:hypothetical protein
MDVFDQRARRLARGSDSSRARAITIEFMLEYSASVQAALVGFVLGGGDHAHRLALQRL